MLFYVCALLPLVNAVSSAKTFKLHSVANAECFQPWSAFGVKLGDKFQLSVNHTDVLVNVEDLQFMSTDVREQCIFHANAFCVVTGYKTAEGQLQVVPNVQEGEAICAEHGCFCLEQWTHASSPVSLTTSASWRLADDVCPDGEWNPGKVTGSAKIALLISGNLRSFRDPRAYKSLRHNFINGLGGKSIVFIYGEIEHERWRNNEDLARFSSQNSQTASQSQLEEELRAVEDYISKDGGPRVISRYVDATPDNIRNTNCSWLHSELYDVRRSEHKYSISALGQVHAVSVSYHMMLKYERTHGMHFDLVARLRPDGLWWHSAPPYCFLKPNFAYFLDDHFWITPRDKAEKVFDAYSEYLRCGNTEPSSHFSANVAVQCCGGGATMVFIGALRRAYPLRSSGEISAVGPTPGVQLLRGSGDQLGLWSFQLLRVVSERPSNEKQRDVLGHCEARYVNDPYAGCKGCRGGQAVYPDINSCYRALRPSS